MSDDQGNPTPSAAPESEEPTSASAIVWPAASPVVDSPSDDAPHTEPVETIESVVSTEQVPTAGAPTDLGAPLYVPGMSASPAPPPVGRLRSTLVAAVAGGLVGAMVASGVFVATKDDDTPKNPGIAGVNTSVITKPRSTQEILAKTLPGVVAIEVTGESPSSDLFDRLRNDDGSGDSAPGLTGAGSGFVISADGVIVTNNHVIDGAKTIEIAFNDGTTKSATVVGRSKANDIAVLKVDAKNLQPIVMGDSNKVVQGDDVLAIGNAAALEGGPTVTRGIVSAVHRQIFIGETQITIEDVIQTDAAVNRGNSGGPLVNSSGEVIGIVTAIADPSTNQNLDFAIAISHARPIIEDLRQGKTIQHAFLGVRTETLTPRLVKELNLTTDEGALVRTVDPGTPAAEAGIAPGDIITKVSGRATNGADDVRSAVRSKRPGDKIKVELDRKGTPVTVTATLGSLPDET